MWLAETWPRCRAWLLSERCMLVVRRTQAVMALVRGEGQRVRIIAQTASVPTDTPETATAVEPADQLKALLSSIAVPREMRGIAVDVVLSDDWINLISVAWHASLGKGSTALQSLKDVFEAKGIALRPGDRLVLDDQPPKSSRIAIHVPGRIRDALIGWTESHQLHLRLIRSLSILAWDFASTGNSATPSALALILDNRVSVLWRDGLSHRTRPTGYASARGQSEGQSPPSTANRQPHIESILRRLLWRSPTEPKHSAENQDGWRSPNDQSDLPKIDLNEGFESCLHGLTHARGKSTYCQALMASDCAVAVSLISPVSASALDDIKSVPLRRAGAATACILVLASASLATWSFSQHEPPHLGSHRSQAQQTAPGTDAPSGYRVPNRNSIQSKQASELVRWSNVSGAIRALNNPLPELLSALESPDGVDITVMSLEASQSSSNGSADARYRLIASAASLQDMNRYWLHLRGQSQLKNVQLITQEPDDNNGAILLTLEFSWDR